MIDTNHSQQEVRKLLLKEKEAADVLGISPRTLWALRDEHKIKCVKIHSLVRYDMDELKAFVTRQKNACDVEPS